MALPPQLDIYKASAGSGKTFLLATQYLQLLFQQPNNFRHILAVTFTNKATAEMKERILGELKNIAEGKQEISGKPNPYATKLLAALPAYNFERLQIEARSIYSNILHDYSRFAVTTIDSFVQRIIRSFAYEIGLDAGFKLQLNTDVVKEDLANRLFRLLDTDQALRHWVAQMAMGRLEDGKSWNFREDMLGLAGELFKEPFQEFETALKEIPDVDEAFKTLRGKVHASIQLFEKRWKETGEHAIQLIQANGLMVDDFNYGKSGFVNYFFKAADLRIEPVGSRVISVMEKPESMPSKKASATAKSAIESIQPNLLFFLERLIALYESDQFVEYNTAVAIARNIGTLRLMQVFSEQLKHYRSDNNTLLISDTHLLLRQLTQETEASFIYEKIGTRFKHFLIDEFQDTSGFQWDNFRPLLENTLAEGNYNLIVGDVKQAIYRWRSGDLTLLQKKVQEDLLSFNLENYSLQDNRRSAKPIIEFNNFLYNAASHLLQQELNAAMDEAPVFVREKLGAAGYYNVIRNAYAESYQMLPENSSHNGSVEIEFLDCVDDEGLKITYPERVLPDLHLKISALLAEGFQAKDIAILTRKNTEAAFVIEYLMNAQQAEDSAKYDLLSAEALLLSNNHAVAVVIAALEMLAGNGSKLALVQLRQSLASYHSLVVTDYDIFISKLEDDKVLPKDFIKSIPALRQLSLTELVSHIIRILSLNKKEEDAGFLLAFQDLLTDWGRFGDEGINEFLQYWEDEGVRKSLPGGANTNAIEVLTVHRSKGLAFTILLMPFLNWELKPDAKKSIQLWVKTEDTSFDVVPLVPVRFGSNLQQTSFAFSYYEELKGGMLDNLNLLYVATTRARRRIVGWAPFPTKTEGLSTVEKLLYAIGNAAEVFPSENEIPVVNNSFDKENNKWTYGEDIELPKAAEIKTAEQMPPLLQTDWLQLLRVKYKPLVTEEADLQLPRKQGVLLHEALAIMQHPNEQEHVLMQMGMRGLITHSQLNNMREALEHILSHEVLKGWKDGSLQRLSEREIITVNKQIRRPDLVLYNANETWVIDFKFTHDKKDSAKHEQQLQEYKSLLSQLKFANVKGEILYNEEA